VDHTTVRFDKVPGIYGSEEFDIVVSAKESFVTVETNAEFRPDITEELQHPRAIDEIATIMSIVRTHAGTNHCGRQLIHRFDFWHGVVPLSLTDR
jgi:hypothetical protein